MDLLPRSEANYRYEKSWWENGVLSSGTLSQDATAGLDECEWEFGQDGTFPVIPLMPAPYNAFQKQ